MEFPEPKIVSREKFKVVGKLYRGDNTNQEIPKLWQEYGPQMGSIPHVVNRHISYGVMDHFDEQTKVFDYLAGQEVSRVEQLPEGLASWEIPAMTYAVVTCTLPTLMQAFDFLYKDWLPASGYERAPGAEFELYDERFDPQRPHSAMELYIPVNQKS